MSDINKKVQIDVTANGQQAKQEFASTANAAKDMSSTIAQAGGAAASSIDKIGDGAGESAQKLDRASKSMIASIQRATAATQAGGQSTSAYFDAISKQRGLNSDALKPYIDQLRAAEAAQEAARASLGRTGITAAQTAAALRGVPAQFTDIATSLASGQAPLTVFLQQGGQLKDMFGGAGAAAKALGGYVASLVTPFTVAAAAIGGIGYAAYAGSAEMDEFKKNLILTGNISGITTDKFNAMAVSMANISGITRGAAAEALTAMAASGNIGADAIERLTRSAIQFEKAGGQAIADTVKQFEELGKSPLEASIKLSDKTHYLTLAVYEQIKALEDQGRVSEAAAVAQKAWADAIEQRTPQMVQNMGLIETALDNLKRSASGVWDFMKGIGRDATSAEQIASLKSKIAEADAGIAAKSINSNRLKQQREQWAAELKELQDAANARSAVAAKQAADADREQKRIAANAGADKLIEAQRSKKQQFADELKKLDAQRAADLLSEDKYQQAKAALAKKYEDKAATRADASAAKKAAREAAEEARKLDDLLAKGGGESANYAENLNRLVVALRAGKITTEQYSVAASKLWKTQTEAGKSWEASADAADKANKALNVWKAEHESQLASITEETSAVGQNAAARKVVLAGLQVEADARKKIEQLSLTLSETDRASAVAAINAEAQKQKAYVETALRKQQAVEGAYQLEQENRRFAAESILDEKQRAQVILDIDAETWRQRIDLAEVGSEERRRLEGAFAQWYSNQLSKPAIESMRKALESIDQTFHDSFTRMLENGKADWDAFGKALATSFKTAVADEIYKMTLKPLVLNVVGSFSGAGATAVPGADGQPLSVSNGFGVLSGAQAAWNGINGGIANAASSFATSGMGQWAGLSTTYGAGYTMGPPTAAGAYGYTAGGTALTSSGSSFVASAAPYAAAIAALAYGDHLMKAGWGLDNNRKGYAASAAGAVAGGVAAGASAGASAGSSVGPVGTVVGAVVGAIAVPVLDRLFGHNNKTNADAAGIQGSFDLSGFSGDQWQQFSKKGGTFRSDKRWTDTYDVSSDIDKELDSAFRKTVAKLQDMGKTLGVETSKSIDGFTHEFSLQLSDNGDMSKAGEKLAGEITRAADELVARMVPNVDEFARLGETASQTFSRLNQEVAATDAILLAMGRSAAEAFGGVGLASIAARENLIDLAGGLDQLANKTQSFYANFYSSEEQLTLAAKQAQGVLDAGFAELNLALPSTREAFRALVESQDLSTESGRKLWNSLLDLQDEFDTVADGADATAASLSAATTTAQRGQASLFDTFASDGQKLAAAQKLVSDTFASIGTAVPENAAAFLSLAQSIDPATEAGQGFVAAMAKVSNAFAYVEKSVADSSAAMVASAQAIAQASQSRRSIQDQFDPAGSAARAQADINAAFAKYGATNLIPTTREGVAQLAGTIDVNSSLGQEQMAALQSLSGAFDAVFGAQERAAQEAAAAAQLSINAAKTAADEQMRLANQVHDSISGALKSLLGQSEQFESQTRQMAQATLQSALVIAKAGGSLSNFQGLDAALASVTKLDKATFATAAGYAVEFGRTANLLTQLEQYTRINGSHENGLDYVPFDGYVAQLHKGERVQTAASAAAADATVAEVKALRSDLNAIGAALATYTQKTAKLMAKFDVEGIYTRA